MMTMHVARKHADATIVTTMMMTTTMMITHAISMPVCGCGQ